MYGADEQGWAGDYDERGFGMSGLGSMSGIGAFAYVPDLGPVGSGSQGTYYPRDTSQDAKALNFLGFMSDPALAAHTGTLGSQKADMAAGAGAWSAPFQDAVEEFQQAAGLGVDGWIGPGTRTALATFVARKNANPVSPINPGNLPAIPGLPPPPPPVPGSPYQPAGDTTTAGPSPLMIAGGVALAVGVLAVGYMALK